MNERAIRPSIEAILPSRMRTRPVDHRGYPVPWFVTEKDADGRWEFRVVRPERAIEAVRLKVCWICGHPLGRFFSFAIGPMCGINRISGEPPQHLECAEFAAQSCPFMLLPKAQRRTANMPEQAALSECAIERNPGVMLIWTTQSFALVPAPQHFLYQLGPPTSLSFWRGGRRATRAEIDESIETGLPALVAMAQQDGGEALEMLGRMHAEFTKLLPAAEGAG